MLTDEHQALKRWRKRAWPACVVAAGLLLALAYSPWVLAPGVTEPWLWGLPRTLWSGLMIAFGIVVVTAIGVWVYPRGERGDEA